MGWCCLLVVASGVPCPTTAEDVPMSMGGFQRTSQHVLDHWGCVDVDRRCKGGPWPALAVGQGGAVHGADGPGLDGRGRPVARSAGASRTAGANWSPGYKVYRAGQVV